MNTERNHIANLLERYATKSATEAEETELFNLITNASNEDEMKSILLSLQENQEPLSNFDRTQWEPVLQSILQNSLTVVSQQKPIRRIPWLASSRTIKRIAVAASILLIIGLGSYFLWFQPASNIQHPVSSIQPTDVQAPQATKATITLADGRIVTLDSAANGTLATQGNINVVKTADGKIIYQSSIKNPASSIQYNTLSNPRGSKVINMTLADGSVVWLNAGSSIKYPVSFASNERRVTMSGEAYFEVAHNADKPFYVSKGDVSVQVLGTHFNVNAYDDESDIKVTLLEGSVRVSSIQHPGFSILKPGQQAQISSDIKVVNGADIEQVMAWKNGLFQFGGSDVETVMRQLSRWYDVDIKYEGPKPIANFRGTISRQESIAEVLKMLELTKAVKFRIEGKTVIVTK